MFKQIKKHIIIVLAAFAASQTFPSFAQDKEKVPAAGEVENVKRSGQFPFHGKLHAVDKTAMTLTLEGKERKRVIHITPQTRFLKNGKPAQFSDAAPGDEIGGSLIRTPEGKEEAVSLRLGPKPEGKATARKSKEEEKRPE